MNYTKEYFIKKFEAIPEEKWCTGEYANEIGQHCALGHCGSSEDKIYTKESRALCELFGSTLVYSVNDDFDKKYTKYGFIPKERILNFIKSI